MKLTVRWAIASLFVGVSAGMMATSANAATFSFQRDDLSNLPGTGTRAGITKSITTTFDEERKVLTWSSTLERNSEYNSLADGAWVVLSEGPNPRKDTDEYAIFYLDGTQNRVVAHHYDGNQKDKSWQSTQFFGGSDLTVENVGNERTFSFEFDVSSLNAQTDTFGDQWKGASFAENIGIWFHAVDSLETDYSENGQLTNFDYTHSSWFDTNAPLATVQLSADQKGAKDIPEPSSAIALGLFAGIVGLNRKANSAQA